MGDSSVSESTFRSKTSYLIQKKFYHDVISRLKAQGFTNVKTVAIEDLVTGWLSFDGEVEKVTIDGISEFRADAVFLRSAEVVIYYHTFK